MWPEVDDTPPTDPATLLPHVLRRGRELRRGRVAAGPGTRRRPGDRGAPGRRARDRAGARYGGIARAAPTARSPRPAPRAPVPTLPDRTRATRPTRRVRPAPRGGPAPGASRRRRLPRPAPGRASRRWWRWRCATRPATTAPPCSGPARSRPCRSRRPPASARLPCCRPTVGASRSNSSPRTRSRGSRAGSSSSSTSTAATSARSPVPCPCSTRRSGTARGGPRGRPTARTSRSRAQGPAVCPRSAPRVPTASTSTRSRWPGRATTSPCGRPTAPPSRRSTASPAGWSTCGSSTRQGSDRRPRSRPRHWMRAGRTLSWGADGSLVYRARRSCPQRAVVPRRRHGRRAPDPDGWIRSRPRGLRVGAGAVPGAGERGAGARGHRRERAHDGAARTIRGRRRGADPGFLRRGPVPRALTARARRPSATRPGPARDTGPVGCRSGDRPGPLMGVP